MLIFDRKAFKSGTQVVREHIKVTRKDDEGKDVEGIETKEYRFSVADKGKSFQFVDEDAVLKAYPVLFKKA